MIYRTHIAFALVLAIEIINYMELSFLEQFVLLIATSFGALMPDLDEERKKTKMSKLWTFLFKLHT